MDSNYRRGGNKLYISRKKFVTYLEVQCDERTDMTDINKVVEMSNIISENSFNRKECTFIQNHYGKLKEKFGIGGVNIVIQSIK